MGSTSRPPPSPSSEDAFLQMYIFLCAPFSYTIIIHLGGEVPGCGCGAKVGGGRQEDEHARQRPGQGARKGRRDQTRKMNMLDSDLARALGKVGGTRPGR